ncbi:hypothetical protein, unlikely [Trypanosoma brucei gambiense DAL972]|uniref:Uncharacterized protein n=1 Tax=Trypanosoma brucei gambiense (strain MHOM/CI/86/DAL972) TaxID=679716 RepID=D0A3K3_TRYB9|nr:hypothetical protein, unlikely [Trypanosoma brucei gambiense DAL972]CBH15847.1 hypothetical protein, unlikely [Trypanosoma brucei gambiense DAL972]|eukprot:XP_011778111.1 hypothetical protein, unlikely [Trypanosoma brucei gambiense DAL972]
MGQSKNKIDDTVTLYLMYLSPLGEVSLPSLKLQLPSSVFSLLSKTKNAIVDNCGAASLQGLLMSRTQTNSRRALVGLCGFTDNWNLHRAFACWCLIHEPPTKGKDFTLSPHVVQRGVSNKRPEYTRWASPLLAGRKGQAAPKKRFS